MSYWYYVHGGERQGPVDRGSLDSLVDSGGLAPDDLVWTEGMEDWKPAREVPGVFTATQPVAEAPETAAEPAGDPANPYASPASMVETTRATGTTSGGLVILEPPAPLTVGGPIQMAMEILKKDFGMIFVAGLVVAGVWFGVAMACWVLEQVVGVVMVGVLGDTAGEAVIIGAVVAVSLVFLVVRGLANTFMMLGLARVGTEVIEGKPVRIPALFGEGRRLFGAFGGTILCGLIIYALPLAAIIPGFIMGVNGDEEMMAFLVGMGGAMFLFPGMYIAARFGLFLPAMVDQDKGAFRAIGESLRITRGTNGWRMFAFLIVIVLINVAGILILCVGLIFTLPLTVLAYFIAYKWMLHGPESLWEIHRPKLPGTGA